MYDVETAQYENLEPILKIERLILRKIFDPKLTEEGYRGKDEIYVGQEDLETSYRKKILSFLGPMVRMDMLRLNRQFFGHLWKMKSSLGFIKQMTEEAARLNIQEKDLDRDNYRKWLQNQKVLSGAKKVRN